MDVSQDLVRGTVVPIVLSLVEERAMYGYEIVKLVNARSNGVLQWREGTLYPALHKLESEKLIKSSWQAAESGKQRKYYTITRKGKRQLAANRAEWQSFSTAVASLLMRA